MPIETQTRLAASPARSALGQVLAASGVASALLAGAAEPARAQAPERLYECSQLASPDEYDGGFSSMGRPSIDAYGRSVFAGFRSALGDSELARCCRRGEPEREVFERRVSCPGAPSEDLLSIVDPEANALGQVVYRADACGESSFLYLSQNDPASSPHRIVDGVAIQVDPGPALGGSAAFYAASPVGLYSANFSGAGPGLALLPEGIFAVAASGVTGDWAAIRSGAQAGVELVVNGALPPFFGLGEFDATLLSVADTFAYPHIAYLTIDPNDSSHWQVEVSGTVYATSAVEPFSFGGWVSGLAVESGGRAVFVYDGSSTWWADGTEVERVRCRNWYDGPAFELGRPFLGRRAINDRGQIVLVTRDPLDNEWIVRLDPLEIANRLENGGFSQGGGLRGWGDGPGDLDPIGAEWSPVDAGDDPLSGSARLLDPGEGEGGDPAGASVRQCVPLAPGRFKLATSTRVPGGANGTGEVSAVWTWLSGDDCAGAPLGSRRISAPTPTPADVWQVVETMATTPTGTRSALVTLSALRTTATSFTAHLDDVVLVPEPAPSALVAVASLALLRRWRRGPARARHG